MAPSWTDCPLKRGDPIRGAYISELRSAVDAAGGTPLGGWTDHPITTATPIRALHLVELRDTIQVLWLAKDLGAIGPWSERGGVAPSFSGEMFAMDVNDLRFWFGVYDNAPPFVHWGVDSVEKANFNLTGPVEKFYDRIVRELGRRPEFWGRYIRLDGLNLLDDDEVAFLHQRACSILLIYRPDEDEIFTHAQGVTAALDAVARADALVGVPSGAGIFLNVEQSWLVTEDWILGWADGMSATRFPIPCYYGGTKNNPNFNGPYCAAVASAPTLMNGSVVWGADWRDNQVLRCAADFPPFSQLVRPGCNDENVRVYQYAGDAPISGGQKVDQDLATGAGFGLFWQP